MRNYPQVVFDRTMTEKIDYREIRFGWVSVATVQYRLELLSFGEVMLSSKRIGVIYEEEVSISYPDGKVAKFPAYRVNSRVRRSDHVLVEMEIFA